MSAERVLRGRSIVKGSAAGKLIALVGRSHDTFRFHIETEQVATELDRLEAAVTTAAEELERTRVEVVDAAGDEIGAIFGAQHLFLLDPELQGLIRSRISEKLMNAEWALTDTVTHLLEKFSQLESTHLRERAEDLRDVGRALLRALTGDTPENLARQEGDDPLVVLAHDLTPSEAIRLSRAGVLAFGLEVGGQTSHTAIIARSLNLPLVAGLSEAAVALPDAEYAIVDGDDGQVILDPDPGTLQSYRDRAGAAREDDAAIARELDAVTTDGVAIRLMANIDLPDELPEVDRYGAEGIGLYRSEFLFIERSPNLPSEEEQAALLCDLIDAAKGRPAVVRTFDLGGRKLAKEVIETHEDNPVLGLRGIRLTLRRRDIFKSQVRAILRASVHGRLRVLLPMVTCVEEIQEFRQLVEECGHELETEGIAFGMDFRLGAMIEVPGAAIIADRLARHVDFLSLGTNDLVQYSLAVDRSNEHVAYLYQPFHPAILRMVRFVADAAREAGIGLVICGEVAADPSATALLLGLGLRHLSITPRAIPMIKHQVRSLELRGLEAVAKECADAESASEVESIMRRAGLRSDVKGG